MEENPVEDDPLEDANEASEVCHVDLVRILAVGPHHVLYNVGTGERHLLPCPHKIFFIGSLPSLAYVENGTTGDVKWANDIFSKSVHSLPCGRKFVYDKATEVRRWCDEIVVRTRVVKSPTLGAFKGCVTIHDIDLDGAYVFWHLPYVEAFVFGDGAKDSKFLARHMDIWQEGVARFGLPGVCFVKSMKAQVTLYGFVVGQTFSVSHSGFFDVQRASPTYQINIDMMHGSCRYSPSGYYNIF